MKKIVISGISGFVGNSLKTFFKQEGYKVVGINREELQDEEKLISIIDGAYAVFNLAGANIINRWTESYKKILYTSRVETTKNIVAAIENSKVKPKVLISTSAVGIYKNDNTYDESCTNLADDFLANLCKDWETEALKAKRFGVRVSLFRLGIVMGNGGALAKMILPFKLGVGGIIGNGSQHFSFIHIEDLIAAYKFVLEDDFLDGIFNLCAPLSTTNYGLTKVLGKHLNRPTILPLPEFLLKLVFSEGANVLTDGQSAIPSRLLNSGFDFKYHDINKTIENLV